MNTLSLAMIVKNEARCLERCLRSVQSLVDEMIVVDTGSTDATAALAEQFHAKVFHFDWREDFSAARNFALAQAAGSWILALDADETVTPELAREIRKFIQGKPRIGRLKVVSDFKRNGQVFKSQAFVSRLFPAGASFEGRIHEQVVSPLPRVNLKGELSHDGYLETNKSDRNVKMLLAEIELDRTNAYLLHQLALEYTSLDRPGDAFPCLQQAYRSMQPADPFAPNVAVDLIYTAMKLKDFLPALGVINAMEKPLADFPDFFLARGLFFMELIRTDTARYISELPKVEQSFQRSLILGETDKYKSVHGSGSFLASYNLGVYYHVLGNSDGERRCFEAAANLGYAPAQAMLQKLAA
jgi:glycosyltransferase involved in cell wall biosynthesis